MRQRGVALLLALWVIALASLLLGGLAVSVQLQQRQSLWQQQHTQATLAAEAGVALAVAGMMQPGASRWAIDGEVHAARFADADLRISVLSERGKLDVNSAPARAVHKLLSACGASRPQAEQIATALERRRSGMPLRLLEEFRALPGVSFALYDCAQAHITVWSGHPMPAPSLASPWLARVLDLPRTQGAPLEAGQIVTVTSAATLASGFISRLTVTLVMLDSRQAGAKPYRVLRWQE